ncbi:unnamed protein product [Effrenium voratum]|uniref:Splicing factor Cactin C-terminal domain-containing protein n=1 Tax=Effrenium voratum TaxID=2562239 RepID=A0AA36IP51_9DINO|nr:unnamed protein product [Effrenium voratum]
MESAASDFEGTSDSGWKSPSLRSSVSSGRSEMLHTPTGPAPEAKPGEEPPPYDWIPTAQKLRQLNAPLQETPPFSASQTSFFHWLKALRSHKEGPAFGSMWARPAPQVWWQMRAKVKSDAWVAKREAEAEEAEAARLKAIKAQEWDDIPSGKPGDEEDGFSPELEPLETFEDEADAGVYSPVLEPLSKYDPDDLLDPDEDQRVLQQVRRTIIEAFGGSAATASADIIDRSRDEELFNAERAKGMSSGEVAFNAAGKGAENEFHGEVMLDKKRYEWEDKYKPRKPRFFNRVKTGFEWTKYNQTHYDHDNPPPKIVQGYKFNIFYPDLIDKTKTPTYHVEKSDTADTVMIRFSAGPPYEDVAFKIVNREWNISHKFGFRVVFDRGVLQLYFNVKRWRYRR